ncbi:TolC family protein [Anditalea andensis]|uniref:Transporter n=1 Tax=Anditalea andensis TaxID=1048983 RepID=A0A074KVQ6_9BACT|nr:TolC family protein [Anditalea andensis]KEO72345.1 transporter [Anditalea andensis]
MKKIYFLLCYLCITQTSFGQQYDISSLTLQESINIALENNINLQRTQLNLLSTQAGLLEARGNMIPTLSLGVGPSRRWGRNLNPVTNLYEESNTLNTMNVAANSSITLFEGRRIANTVKQSKLLVEAGRYDVAASENEISLSVINLFVNIVFAKEQVNIANTQLQTNSEQLARTRRLVEAGTLPTADRLDLEAQEATSELEVINARNNLRIAKLNLSQLLQIPFAENFDISFPDLQAENYAMVDESVNEIFAVALNTLPQIKAAELGLESAEYGEKIAKGAFMPTISANASAFSNYARVVSRPELPFNPFFTQLEGNLAPSISVNLNIPILSNFRNTANLQRARVQTRQQELQQVETRNQLLQDIETGYTNALAARQSYNASVRRVAALEESFRMSQQRFNVGAVNSVDFQVAQNNLFNAQADLLNAKYEYIFRVKVLDFYLGKPVTL